MTAMTPEEQLGKALTLRKNLRQHDMQVAISLLGNSARRFSLSGAHERAAYAELEMGETYEMMSGYDRALMAYRQSLAFAASQPEARCAALSHIARAYANMGHAHEADQYSTDLASYCGTLSDKRVLADVYEAQGEVSFWSANMKDATAKLIRARDLAAQVDDADEQALSTMMLAQTVNLDSGAAAGNHEEAVRLAWKALRLWLAVGNGYGAARAHLTLGFFASTEGNFRLAQCHCESALPVFRRVADRDNAAIASNVLGMVGRESGDMEASLSDYRQARRDFVAAGDDLGEAESITGIADVLVRQHNYSDLLPLYARKFEIARKTGSHALLASALIDLASVYFYQKKYSQAEVNYEKGLAEYRAAGNRYGESVALVRLAELRVAQKRFEDALDLYGQAQKLKEKTTETEDLAGIQYSRARIYWWLNRLELAHSAIEKTIAIIESQRLRMDKFDSRAQYFASVHEYYSLYIQLLMALHERHPDRGFDRLAFEAAEKSKVRALLDLLANSQAASPCEELMAQGSGTATSLANLQTEVPSNNTAKALNTTEIQAEIGDGNTVLVEYALGDAKSYAWVVDGEKISAVELAPAAEIRRRVRLFREALALPPLTELETSTQYLERKHEAERNLTVQSRKLARLLLGPLDLPSGKRLLIVPDGPLQYVTFAVLLIGIDEAPLVERHELSMLPSASVLAALRKAASARKLPAEGVAIFADPVFENPGNSASPPLTIHSQRGPELQRALRDYQGSQRIAALPGSRVEAMAIREIVGPSQTRLALAFDANREAVINGSLARKRVIHFATHGIVDTLHPEMSGLILSLFNKRGEPQEGYLRLSDIYKLKLSADLVVLSSCESALGKDLESEGIIGLPRGFLYAGARSVIASLWKVDDDATATLMKGLYSRMQRGESPSNALHGAQLDLLKGQRFSEPYYWAAFVLEGDYK
jgi:CHAT domain-containing protein